MRSIINLDEAEFDDIEEGLASAYPGWNRRWPGRLRTGRAWAWLRLARPETGGAGARQGQARRIP